MQKKMQVWYDDKEKRRETMRAAAANGANRKQRLKALSQLKSAKKRQKPSTELVPHLLTNENGLSFIDGKPL